MAAPALLLLMRVLQGFALGGEYGGAAIYVAEHAEPHNRGFMTSWINTTAALGLIGALVVILVTRMIVGVESFDAWGWRIPFILSGLLLAISLWIRLKLNESPAFRRMEAEGGARRAPYREAFLTWKNGRFVLIALFGVMFAQGAVWYCGYFYTRFFMERMLKIDVDRADLGTAQQKEIQRRVAAPRRLGQQVMDGVPGLVEVALGNEARDGFGFGGLALAAEQPGEPRSGSLRAGGRIHLRIVGGDDLPDQRRVGKQLGDAVVIDGVQDQAHAHAR